MRDPNRLRVVDLALDIAEETFRVTRDATVLLPIGLAAQMQRAAVSVGSNISEGCGRSTEPQFLAFLQIAMGSACELEFQLRLAKRCTVTSSAFDHLHVLVVSMRRMLARLTTSVRGH